VRAVIVSPTHQFPTGVALLGSLSKTLSPALGIGWVVAPPAWAGPLRDSTGPWSWPSTLDQLAFAAFLRAGSYDRHLRAARKRYRLRRDRLVRALTERLPGARLLGVAAGLHLLVHLDGVDAAAVVGRAAAAGMRVANLDTYRCRADAARPGLVLGYGNLADGQVDEAVALLAATVAELGGPG
jgi:GntR family transcriptional regulator / MocR family aminotransferase